MARTTTTTSSRLLTLVVLAAMAGCGARQEPTTTAATEPTPTPAPAPREPALEPEAKTAKATPEQALSQDIPTECATYTDICVPPKAFAEQLCKGKYPELAITLFGKGMPWQKAYVKAEHLEPVNAYGGQQSEQWLKFGEEVLVMKKHVGDSSGVQVSGPKDLDILRLDGTCATVRSEMLVNYIPSQIVRPHIIWKYLDGELQQTLLADKYVKQASEKERDHCKGSSVTHPQGACDKAMRRLTDAIVNAARKDIALPTPEKLPSWAK